MEEKRLMSVTSNPHIRDNCTTQKIMMHVIIALMPATLFGIWHFGAYTIAVILVTVISAMFFEWLYEKLMHLPVPCKIRFILFGPCKVPQNMRKTFLVM